MLQEATIVQDSESRSSLFEKLPADLRRRLDQAIIDREPAAYRAVYARFDLAARGVSFTAFYYYARRRRVQADLLQLAELALPDTPDLAGALPDLLAYRLFEAATDEATSPSVLHRLVDAWRIAAGTCLALQRHASTVAEVRRQHQEPESAGPGRALDHAGKRRRAARASATDAACANLKLAARTQSPAKAAGRAKLRRRGSEERQSP